MGHYESFFLAIKKWNCICVEAKGKMRQVGQNGPREKNAFYDEHRRGLPAGTMERFEIGETN